MKRILLLATAIITFFSGVTVSRLTHPNPGLSFSYSTCRKAPKRAFRSEVQPLRAILPPIKEAANKRIPYEHSFAIVENVSDKPIRWYVLGFGTDLSNVGASGFMTDNGVSYTYPDLKKGPLIPGETRVIPIKASAEFSEEYFVSVDYLQFEDGSTWGPNKSRTRIPQQ
jgi:hypothetical protein